MTEEHAIYVKNHSESYDNFDIQQMLNTLDYYPYRENFMRFVKSTYKQQIRQCTEYGYFEGFDNYTSDVLDAFIQAYEEWIESKPKEN